MGYLATIFGRSVTRATRNEQAILFVLAIAIGLAAAYGAVGFVLAVDFMHTIGFGVRSHAFLTAAAGISPWRVVAVPVLGGLAIGVFLHATIKGGRVHGVAHVIEANAINRGRLPNRSAFASAIGSAASIGVGASTGREGPVIHLAAWMGAWLAKRLQLGQSLSRTLLG